MTNKPIQSVITIAGWLANARRRLAPTGDSPHNTTLDAQVLLAASLGKSRAWLLAHPEESLSLEHSARLEPLLDQLANGAPLPYLTGRQEFYGLDFAVTPDVLIPRPETELLVEHALRWLQSHPAARRVVDVGTGSGCIAVTLAAHRPELSITAVDRSWAALQVARANSLRHNVADRVYLLQSDLLSALSGPFDLVCANLPYIPSRTLAGLDVARHEPQSALDGGPDGLRLIASLLADAPRLLAPHALMLLEIEAGQGQSAAALAARYFPQAAISVLPDLADLPRLLVIEQNFSS